MKVVQRPFRSLILMLITLATIALLINSYNIVIYPAYGAVIPSSFGSYPSDYATDLIVSDPEYAYDRDDFTYAEFSRDADGHFELTDFSQRSGKINWVDFKMRCGADASTDDKYRILYLVDPSPEETVLVDWTSSLLPEMTRVWSFAAEPGAEPNDGVWSWTDISNVRFRVEIDSVGEPDGAYFRVLEAWLTVFVNYPIVSVDPPEIVDPALVPGAEFTIDIVVDYVEKLALYQFEMSFNPAVLEGVSVEDGPFLSSGGGDVTVFPSTPQFNNTAGMLNLFGATLTDPTVNNPLGGGVLAIVTFRVVGDGASDLTLSEYTLLMDATGAVVIDGSKMPVCLKHAYFSNIAPSATLCRRSAWPEHHHWDESKDLNLTLTGKVHNDGDFPGLIVRVRFDVSYYDGTWSETFYTGTTTIDVCVIVDLTVTITRADLAPTGPMESGKYGTYHVKAQVEYLYPSIGLWVEDGKTKDTKFTIVP